jgi:hypothetical protein
MFYFCIENNIVTSIMPYLPTVPNTVEVVEVTDEDYNLVKNDTHKFDISSKKVIPHSSSYLETKATTQEKEQNNASFRQLLNSTDWKILRHIRQKALDLPTSLTEQEYIALENQRQLAASQIS